jgi:hypothetical protein
MNAPSDSGVSDVAISVSDPRGTAFVVHVERCNPHGRRLIRALPHSKHQRPNALSMVQFPLSVFLESGSIAILF